MHASIRSTFGPTFVTTLALRSYSDFSRHFYTSLLSCSAFKHCTLRPLSLDSLRGTLHGSHGGPLVGLLGLFPVDLVAPPLECSAAVRLPC